MSVYPSDLHYLDLVEQVDLRRKFADGTLAPAQRQSLGQFMTPAPISRFMASLFTDLSEAVSLLDPGAGVGSLTSAFVARASGIETGCRSVMVEAYELDELMMPHLAATLADCARACHAAGVSFDWQIHAADFIEAGVNLLRDNNTLFAAPLQRYSHCIMNPPYRKISSSSHWRRLLQQVGVETSNLYTGFLAIATQLLAPGGELVAIVPRSFCNGVYFRPFREFFLHEMSIKHLHVFDARDKAFKDNDVLQENIILHAIKGGVRDCVTITSSFDAEIQDLTYRRADYDQIVKPDDPHQFINIATSDADQLVVNRLSRFTATLGDLDIAVSTGPVVDFRLKDELRQELEPGAVPLIYPGHMRHHFVTWPKPNGAKPNAIMDTDQSRAWLMPNGWYVVIRRFSAKEEKRRVVAGLHDPDRVAGSKIGFENHLNVIHANGAGLDPALAKGLALYLNSTLVDLYFRQFSGHTQVNANDLRILPYPGKSTLTRWGQLVTDQFPTQNEIDAILEAEVQAMTTSYVTSNPVDMQRKIQEALAILSGLGMPRAQRNDRSALTLLALLDLKPGDSWLAAADPLRGITPIMDFVRDHYGRTYAPNTRETFRRQTMHQFVQAGIAVSNPDDPERAINSPKWVYRIAPEVLSLVRNYTGNDWQSTLTHYLKEQGTLAQRYARERDMSMIPLRIPGQELRLTPGAHNELIKAIIEEFGPRFAPGAEVLYVGDTGSKMVHFDGAAFGNLGLTFDTHGKFPDVILYYREMNWLFLIEAVTSHGPVNAKRHAELELLFTPAIAGLVYITAFPSRQSAARYLVEIGWETEVWFADEPTHLIHYNGENFVGPH